MKKKTIAVLTLLSLILTSFSNVFALNTDVVYNDVNEINFSWNGLSSYNTLLPNASFNLEYKLRGNKAKNYIIEIECSNGERYSFKEKVEPNTDIKKTYKLTLKKGKYDFNISVKNGNETEFSLNETAVVMEPYTHQFMDELSVRGINESNRSTDSYEYLDAWTSAAADAGLKLLRAGDRWDEVEDAKGNYKKGTDSYDKMTSVYKSKGLRFYAGTSWANKLYPAEDGMTKADWKGRTSLINFAKTPEALKGYANFAMFGLDYTKKNFDYDLVSISNEPNLESFNASYVSDINGDIRMMAGVYADVFKSTAIQLLKRGYEWADVMGPDLAAMQNEFTSLMFDYGVYPYMDIYSYHPYPEKDAFIAPYQPRTTRFYVSTKFFDDQVLNYGGWKRVALPETGFSTFEARNRITEQEAAESMLKVFSYADIYDMREVMIYRFINRGDNPSNKESNWGLFDNNLNGKNSVPAIAFLNTKTLGASLAGSMNLGREIGTNCMVYNKDGKPVILAWTDEKDGIETTFDGQNLKVTDMYGNLVSEGKNTVKVGISPVYIENADAKYFAAAAYDSICGLNSTWLENYSDKLEADELSKFKESLTKAESMLSKNPSSSETEEIIDIYKNLGNRVIELGEEYKISELEVSQMLFELYRPMRFAINLYISKYNGSAKSVTDSYDAAYKKAKALYKDDIKIKQYSDAILDYAKRYYNDTKTVTGLEDNPVKAGVISGWNKMTDILCGWFDKFSIFEKDTNIGLQIQIPHYERQAYTNSWFEMNMNLTNYSNDNFSGKIVCCDENGKTVGETERFVLSADEVTKKIKLAFQRKGDSGQKYSRYTLKFINDKGVECATQVVDVRVKDKYEFRIEPVYEGIENVKQVTAKATNITDEARSLTVKVKGDENLQFRQDTYSVTIPANSTVPVNLTIKEIKDADYHKYAYSYELYDEQGNLCATKSALLNFTAVKKSNTPIDISTFDGSDEQWKDAYPLYINAPNNPLDEDEWNKSTLSAKIYTKWDSEHMYIYADVYDDKHLQEYYESNMWQGDCMQVSIDPLNDNNTKAYAADDFELGFSKTSNGDEFYAWQSPNGLSGGEVEWLKIIRNDATCRTKYIISFDKNIISNLKLENGNVFGMNFVLNDADMLGRDAFYQFTKGTADAKNPSLYADFKFVD